LSQPGRCGKWKPTRPKITSNSTCEIKLKSLAPWNREKDVGRGKRKKKKEKAEEAMKAA